MSDADLLDNQVGKFWKNGHWLELKQQNVLLEECVRFLSLPHFASASLRKNQNMDEIAVSPNPCLSPLKAVSMPPPRWS